MATEKLMATIPLLDIPGRVVTQMIAFPVNGAICDLEIDILPFLMESFTPHFAALVDHNTVSGDWDDV